MWQVVSANSGAIAAISSAIAAIAIIAIFWQAIMLRKGNKLNAFNSFLEAWGSVKDREDRGFVLRQFKFNGSLNELSDEQREKVEAVLGKCNVLCLMTLEGAIPKKDVLKLLGRPMIRCWDKLEGFVNARRRQAGESEDGEEWGYVYPYQQFVNKYRAKLGLKDDL